jgi:hypothetical protein
MANNVGTLDPQFKHLLWQRLVSSARSILFEEIMTDSIWHDEYRAKLLEALESERDAMFATYKAEEVESEALGASTLRDR